LPEFTWLELRSTTSDKKNKKIYESISLSSWRAFTQDREAAIDAKWSCLPELEPSSCKVSDISKQAWTIVAKNYNLKNLVKKLFSNPAAIWWCSKSGETSPKSLLFWLIFSNFSKKAFGGVRAPNFFWHFDEISHQKNTCLAAPKPVSQGLQPGTFVMPNQGSPTELSPLAPGGSSTLI
jgi:hypothetical protein